MTVAHIHTHLLLHICVVNKKNNNNNCAAEWARCISLRAVNSIDILIAAGCIRIYIGGIGAGGQVLCINLMSASIYTHCTRASLTVLRKSSNKPKQR